ncbi:hypothetical protein [Paracoccus sp. SCSIO 75233]|nr:hypothetical protein [Paracoccus sp. SCSIO 75233]WBU54843.1 hypothetical protein PAF12_09710 [Paracoccus sp. SCSIO 75233]
MFIFRLIRLCILLMLAFVAGMFFERGHQMDLCEKSGGVWLRAGICGGP